MVTLLKRSGRIRVREGLLLSLGVDLSMTDDCLIACISCPVGLVVQSLLYWYSVIVTDRKALGRR